MIAIASKCLIFINLFENITVIFQSKLFSEKPVPYL